MKQFVVFCMIMLGTLSLSAQVEFGIKAGISSYDLADDFQKWRDADADIKDVISDAGYGYHFGLYSRLKLPLFYIEPAILLNSNKVSYNLAGNGTDSVFNNLKKERYYNIDVPIMLGTKIWFFRVQGGPVAHVFLNSSSELTDIKGYGEKFKDARFGYQAGIGLDLKRLRLDVNYEGNFSSFGDTINVGGATVNIDDNAARIVMSLGYKF